MATGKSSTKVSEMADLILTQPQSPFDLVSTVNMSLNMATFSARRRISCSSHSVMVVGCSCRNVLISVIRLRNSSSPVSSKAAFAVLPVVYRYRSRSFMEAN